MAKDTEVYQQWVIESGYTRAEIEDYGIFDEEQLNEIFCDDLNEDPESENDLTEEEVSEMSREEIMELHGLEEHDVIYLYEGIVYHDTEICEDLGITEDELAILKEYDGHDTLMDREMFIDMCMRGDFGELEEEDIEGIEALQDELDDEWEEMLDNV